MVGHRRDQTIGHVRTKYSGLQTAVDRGRDRAQPSWVEVHGLCMLARVVCCYVALEFSAAGRSQTTRASMQSPLSLCS
ncbi:hypothetical protein Y032_0068g145 [Ancylostoma ceylanicum]|nr:hypothetical protein Y032_0068g145 [Ancylostoma ceylanicum]